MKKTLLRITVPGILIITLVACVPAKIIQPPTPNDDNKAHLRIYRIKEFTASGIPAIIGEDRQDYFELWDGAYEEALLPAGDYNFFVRSNQGDSPYKLQLTLEHDKVTCVNVKPRSVDFLTFIPLVFYFRNAFFMDKIECPVDVHSNPT